MFSRSLLEFEDAVYGPSGLQVQQHTKLVCLQMRDPVAFLVEALPTLWGRGQFYPDLLDLFVLQKDKVILRPKAYFLPKVAFSLHINQDSCS